MASFCRVNFFVHFYVVYLSIRSGVKGRSAILQISEKLYQICTGIPQFAFVVKSVSLRVEFLLNTDSGYPKDKGVTLFTGSPWESPPL